MFEFENLYYCCVGDVILYLYVMWYFYCYLFVSFVRSGCVCLRWISKRLRVAENLWFERMLPLLAKDSLVNIFNSFWWNSFLCVCSIQWLKTFKYIAKKFLMQIITPKIHTIYLRHFTFYYYYIFIILFMFQKLFYLKNVLNEVHALCFHLVWTLDRINENSSLLKAGTIF